MIDPNLQTRLQIGFRRLQRTGAASFPPASSLSAALERIIPQSGAGTVQVDAELATLFISAAVDIWLRGVHSFLISASLVRASPIWASVAGYYSSHYSVRGIAHLLGFFQLNRRKKIAQVEYDAGRFTCSFRPKRSNDAEHKFYWRIVSRDPLFANHPLFPINDDQATASDAGHRNRANYSDHIQRLPNFEPLHVDVLKRRIDAISEIEFNEPPIPKTDEFPDIDSVQVVAYHRIVRFRRLLDDILEGRFRFWDFHRNPSWVQGVIDFQLIEPGRLGIP